MDADVFPVASMDHHFERRTLPRTTFAAGKLSPLNGGWTVLAPARATFAALYDAVRAGGERFLADRSQFDKKRGWGAELVGWRAGTGAGGDGWTFNAAWSDQGLLYYHFRFVDAGGCDIVTLPFLLKDDGEPAPCSHACCGVWSASPSPRHAAGSPRKLRFGLRRAPTRRLRTCEPARRRQTSSSSSRRTSITNDSSRISS